MTRPTLKANGPGRFGLIIGGMKCGTTTLFEVLSQHPQVAPCQRKEPDFFATPEEFEKGLDHYFTLWDWRGDHHRIAIEASTAYSKHPWFPGVPRRIATSLPPTHVKFIYMVRHPVRRIASQVRHGLYEGWGSSLESGIPGDLIDYSRYASQLDQYLEFFSPSQLHVVVLEDYHRDPRRCLSGVCEFLGLSSDFVFDNPGRVTNSGDFFELPSPVAKLARSQVTRGLLSILPGGVKRDLRESLARAAGYLRRNKQGRKADDPEGRWQPTPDEEARIVSQLSTDLRKLRDLWGVDVEGSWNLQIS